MARSRAVARACQRLRCRVRCAIRRGPSAPPSRPRKAGRGARSRKPEPSGKVGDSWPRPGRPLTGLPRREGHEPDSNLHVPGDAPRGRHDLAPLAFLVHADGQVWQFGDNDVMRIGLTWSFVEGPCFHGLCDPKEAEKTRLTLEAARDDEARPPEPARGVRTEARSGTTRPAVPPGRDRDRGSRPV